MEMETEMGKAKVMERVTAKARARETVMVRESGSVVHQLTKGLLALKKQQQSSYRYYPNFVFVRDHQFHQSGFERW